MTRYIDADALKEYFNNIEKYNYGEFFSKWYLFDALDQQPTVEAIPIEWVICKRNEHKNDGFAWIFEAVLEDWRREHDTAD